LVAGQLTAAIPTKELMTMDAVFAGAGQLASRMITVAGVALLATSATAPATPVAEHQPVSAAKLRPSPPGRLAGPERPPAPRPAVVPAGPVGPVSELDDLGPLIPAVFTGDIPITVLDAYRRARDAANLARPGCRLPVELLAAIGKVETGHARGGQVDSRGDTVSPILGPALNGNGFAVVPDTDGGSLDGDRTWDRGVGPMQFIPSTWRRWAADGNGDRRADPHNVYDATLAAARYLCAANRDLGTPQGLDEAIRSYDHSASYRTLVLRWMATYTNGTIAVPDATGTPVQAFAAVPPINSTPPASGPPAPSTPLTPPVGVPTTPRGPTSAPPAPPTDPAAPATPPAAEPNGPVQRVVCGADGLVDGLVGGLLGGLLGPITGTPVLPLCPAPAER
jgi:hypothetical protein